MILTDATWNYFAQIPFRVRSALAQSQSSVPFEYEDKLFFKAYDALCNVWAGRKSQRAIADSHSISRHTLKKWETSFGSVFMKKNIVSINLLDYFLYSML